MLLSGNEAIARGAIEARIDYITGYPGSPVTEIGTSLEPFAEGHFRFEWSTNEAVALEKVFAASWLGLRTLAFMKDAGLNVASDAFRAMAEKESNGGMVIVVGTDPQPETSQTSQDTRGLIADTQVPILEPADSSECLALTKEAFRLSESYRLPVVLRINTWVAQTRQSVRPEGLPRRSPATRKELVVDRPLKYVTSIPTYGADVAARTKVLGALERAEGAKLCRISRSRHAEFGIVLSNLLYHQVQEAIRDSGLCVEVTRLQMAWPLPNALLLRFAAHHKQILVLEEQMPFVETELQALVQRAGLSCVIWGKRNGALTPFKAGIIGVAGATSALMKLARYSRKKGKVGTTNKELHNVTFPRKPTFCPGCPHPVTHFALNYKFDSTTQKWVKRTNLLRSSDTGCYGSLASYVGLGDLKFHMGAGFGCVGGLVQCEVISHPDGTKGKRPVLVAFSGDSTFWHSALARLVDAVAQQIACLFLVFDNHCIAMAGGQPTPQINIARVCRGLGLKTKCYSSSNLRTLSAAFEKALLHVSKGGQIVVIREASCPKASENSAPTNQEMFRVDETICTRCGFCIEAFPCPALVQFQPETCPAILADLCVGCGSCVQVCKYSPDSDERRKGRSAIVKC